MSGSVEIRRAAEVQVVLEGVPLPASKRTLVQYAARQDDELARLLEPIPDRDYRSLDEVGEELVRVQPRSVERPAPLPREESGLRPGGVDYLRASPEPGAVRESAPPSNPPQKTLEQQTKTNERQAERQKQLG